MNNTSRKYNSKVLLFGEYSIIKGSSALAFAFDKYAGSWDFDTSVDNTILQNWLQYINEEHINFEGLLFIDVKRFEADLLRGLYFKSEIPIGYGVGSSGALCAAFYNEYSFEDKRLAPNHNNIEALKSIFQTLEHFFHGSSSGVDPLICYFNQPLLLKGKAEAELITFNPPTNKGGMAFLLNTKQPRQTEPLVNYFLQKLQNKEFEAAFEKEWCVYNEKMIAAFLNQDYDVFFEHLQLLSAFQFEHLPPMIPKGFEKLWEASLRHQAFTLKLCGAGGGGFLLGFTRDTYSTLMALSKEFEVIKILDL
jgi:mevalonate kinase